MLNSATTQLSTLHLYRKTPSVLNNATNQTLDKLTCDKLCSFPEMGQDEIADDVKARKQEYTDLQETQKNFMRLQLAL